MTANDLYISFHQFSLFIACLLTKDYLHYSYTLCLLGISAAAVVCSTQTT